MIEKKKHKVLRMKQISLEDITRVDESTFYVPRTDRDKEPYFVYKSLNIGWTCDCLSFVFNMKDTNDTCTPPCKHIKMVISSFFSS
jgi:hypothetical protein